MAVRSKAAADKQKLTREVSVMAWIEDKFGKVLLLKQKGGRQLWTLPGGKVRPREFLEKALRREVEEETGFKIHAPVLCGVFDRAERNGLTFLYRVRIRGNSDLVYPNFEIETAKYSATLPRDSTPSLLHFWRLFGPGSRPPGTLRP